jgi:hypothetical protein
MYSLPRGVFAALRVPGADYPLAAIVLVAPGMLLDTVGAIWFSRAFPNIAPESAGLFGGWLLFCNVVALLSAVSARPREDVRTGSGGASPRLIVDSRPRGRT